MKSGNNFATHAIMDNPGRQTEFRPLPSPAPLLEKAQTLASPESPAITVRDLSVAFGERRVLKAVSLDIPVRAVTAIIGPSGCGKSTFLRAINRMHDLVPTDCRAHAERDSQPFSAARAHDRVPGHVRALG